MKAMQKGSFWAYSGWALVIAMIATLFLRYAITPDTLYPTKNPDYATYQALTKEYENWQRENKGVVEQQTNSVLQRMVEEIIAGVTPTTNLTAITSKELVVQTEILANVIHRLNTNQPAMDAKQRAEFLHQLFLSPNHTPRISTWFHCSSDKTCNFVGPLSVLNDPIRLAQLLAGDPGGVQADLLTKLPEQIPPAKFNRVIESGSPSEILPEPEWLLKATWLVFSLIFAFVFFIAGLIYHDHTWSHPFETFPDFVLAWIIMLVFLPGFMLCYMVYAMTRSVKPAIEWGKSMIIRQPFEDEYDAVAKKLEALRGRAGGNKALLDRIEQALGRVRDGQNRALLRDLKETLGGIETLEGVAAGLDEIERELGPDPKA